MPTHVYHVDVDSKINQSSFHININLGLNKKKNFKLKYTFRKIRQLFLCYPIFFLSLWDEGKKMFDDKYKYQ